MTGFKIFFAFLDHIAYHAFLLISLNKQGIDHGAVSIISHS